jgi:hypothetical protein
MNRLVVPAFHQWRASAARETGPDGNRTDNQSVPGTPLRTLTTAHKLQGRGAVDKPVPIAIGWCVVVAKRRPRPASFMRLLGGVACWLRLSGWRAQGGSPTARAEDADDRAGLSAGERLS